MLVSISGIAAIALTDERTYCLDVTASTTLEEVKEVLKRKMRSRGYQWVADKHSLQHRDTGAIPCVKQTMRQLGVAPGQILGLYLQQRPNRPVGT